METAPRQAWDKNILASRLRTHVLGASWQEGKFSLLLLPALNKRGLEPSFILLLSFEYFQSSCLFVLGFSLFLVYICMLILYLVCLFLGGINARFTPTFKLSTRGDVRLRDVAQYMPEYGLRDLSNQNPRSNVEMKIGRAHV